MTETVQHSKLLKRWRFKNYFTSFWNCMDLLSHFTFVLALVLRQILQDDWQTYTRNMFALSLLFIYLRFLEAFLYWKTTGIAVIMILQMVTFFSFLSLKKKTKQLFNPVMTLSESVVPE